MYIYTYIYRDLDIERVAQSYLIEPFISSTVPCLFAKKPERLRNWSSWRASKRSCRTTRLSVAIGCGTLWELWPTNANYIQPQYVGLHLLLNTGEISKHC